jgi:hypothetical protein
MKDILKLCGRNMKKIIFLDIDGVLTSYEDLEEDYCKLSKECVNVLNKIINTTNAQCVLTSDRRRIGGYKKVLEEYLRPAGFCGKLIGQIGDSGLPRGLEINNWLFENNFQGKFVIIDDVPNVYPFCQQLIQTDCFVGLEYRHINKVVKFLS